MKIIYACNFKRDFISAEITKTFLMILQVWKEV